MPIHPTGIFIASYRVMTLHRAISLSTDFLEWLLPVVSNFPRDQRLSFSQRMLRAALELHEQLLAGNVTRRENDLDFQAATEWQVQGVRYYVGTCTRWGWLSEAQYSRASELLAAIQLSLEPQESLLEEPVLLYAQVS